MAEMSCIQLLLIEFATYVHAQGQFASNQIGNISKASAQVCLDLYCTCYSIIVLVLMFH